MAAVPPSHARAVVIGGGIVGCSVAYHLSALGWKDIMLGLPARAPPRSPARPLSLFQAA